MSETPFKPLSVAETRRKQLFLPLLLTPFAITAYFAVGPNGQGFSWFSLHPLLMLLGFLTCAGLASLTKKIPGKLNTEYHGSLMFAGSVFACMGGYVIWSNKNHFNREHFTTPHGQFGALVLTVFLVYPVVAYVALNPDTGLLRTQAWMRRMHRYSGRFILLMGLITSCYGIASLESDEIKAGGLMLVVMATTPFFLL